VSGKKEKEKRQLERIEQALAALKAPSTSSALTKWYESSLFWGLMGLGVAIVALVIKPSPVMQACLLAVAWLCFCGSCWIVLHGVQSWWIARTVMVLFSVLSLGGLAWMWVSMTGQESPERALLVSQEINELMQFLGPREESQLENLFDFRNMADFNAQWAKKDKAPELVTKEEELVISKYLSGGGGLVDGRFGRLSRAHEGVWDLEEEGSSIAKIATSKRYVENKNKLSQFSASPYLPSDAIRAAVKELDQTVQDDVLLLFDVLNEQLRRDPNNVFYNGDVSSKYGNVTTSAYMRRVTPLKPKADKVAEAVRSYLKIE
jgi:hypothetical protein